MTSPTHVLVAVPNDCAECNSTGIVTCSWIVTSDGPVCPECLGQRFKTERVTLADFAKLLREAEGSTKGGKR